MGENGETFDKNYKLLFGFASNDVDFLLFLKIQILKIIET